jgi:hypothetical protein
MPREIAARKVFRAPAGSWAFRYYDAAGQRHQRNGFRTRGEAGAALDEALRRVRLGRCSSRG